MEFKIVDGKLAIDLSDLARDPRVLRQIAAHALFEEWVMTAIAGFLVSGECQWNENDPPWWMGVSGGRLAWEGARAKVAALAPEITRKLVSDLIEARDNAVKESREWMNKYLDEKRRFENANNAIRILRKPIDQVNDAEADFLFERGWSR